MKNTSNRLYLIFGWLSIGLAILCFLYSYFTKYLPTQDIQQVGPFGDWLAGVTAPFLNLAGFFMIYAAFRQQSADTQATRHEFHLQRFEGTFFHLIHLHHQNLHAIQLNYGKKSREDFFEASYRYLKKTALDEQAPHTIEQKYGEFYEDNYNLIDHFVRHLLFSIQFIAFSSAFEGEPAHIAQKERQKYADILSAQLSTDELFILYYHCLFDPGKYAQSYTKLLTKYNFFERLSKTL